MYSGALEEQAKRKATSILQDEINRILNATRELARLPDLMTRRDKEGIKDLLNQIADIEDEVETHRRKITKEVGDVGGLIMNRENLLNTAFTIDEIAGHITGISFKLSNIKATTLKSSKMDKDLTDLIELVVDEVLKLNEITRNLNTNSAKAIELAQETQEIEREIDTKYRQATIKAMKSLKDPAELILMKDVIDGIEEMADKCQEVSDSFIMLAFSL
ncbi:MAG: DUF47 family protein [Cenarchaeum sp. SB0665_bin_23]|nr:DUF47 family protein [Cenarchaeum sp. SB0667_bin_13]MXY37330.1 DUF47 family protein [Cenarchaeum sp. SB0664_bin_35]MXY61074.1 DUF47 family protein [Cenarchaeum sp. SB0665_bin_23]MXZ94284.1 DUF47 family protein [Cenarchaeum sp. SB0666_bin_15]MYB47644.1 DUF47 family protein [Cenarchaeum sp. SB0662_bin_33]MYC80272.1 DUF47 family protein [Cenarchaeum sp. SB0661_bin_35]MYD58450.1 DUF47 family protein [Cenarchaeum sp. SB0678_bin_8]MYG32613.1 DUF47 family protein [Cenarchaeum sp. SB0677_bin_16]